MKTILLIIILMGCAGSSKADEPSPVTPVENVDLQRYAGKWYEIARLPNKFQRKCESNTTAEYSLLPDGKIRVVNSCRKADGTYTEAEGIARKEDPDGTNARLKVRFAPSWLGWLPFVWGTYWVIDLASDYSYAVVGEPSRKYLWILSRTPEMSEDIREPILARLKTMGYDTEKLIYTVQQFE
jgi:apolipoprotein D and lipocalin family protein